MDLVAQYENATLTDGMVLIKAGIFKMGRADWAPYEKPIHDGALNDYCIDETLVTNRQFSSFWAFLEKF